MPEFALVSDFDGTITAEDFYDLAVRELLTPEDIKPWNDFLAGKLTHFAALQKIFNNIRAPRAKVMEVVNSMGIDPELAASINSLRAKGWEVIVASAGCLWYIDILLNAAGVNVERHGNPGTYPENGPLLMTPPLDDPFFCPETGINKPAIVRHQQSLGKTTAYAGDGYTDLAAALLVPANLRFARGPLARELKKRGESFRPFNAWSDIARMLLAGD